MRASHSTLSCLASWVTQSQSEKACAANRPTKRVYLSEGIPWLGTASEAAASHFCSHHQTAGDSGSGIQLVFDARLRLPS